MTKINDKRSARYVSLSLILILAVSACCSACGAAAPDDGEALAPTTRDKQIATSFARLLEGRHVSKIKIDEAVSERSFELFLKAIDPTKLYFNQSDVELFAAQYAKTMALQAKTGVVTPARVDVKIFPPIETAGISRKEEKEIADRVEALIREGVAELVQLQEDNNG